MEQNKKQEIVPPKINTALVGELTREVLASRTSIPIFRINLSAEIVYNYLTAHYMAMVALRGREYIDDGNTRMVIYRLSLALTAARPRCGVMLCGTCGNGKTTLVYAIQSVINKLNKEHHFSFLPRNYKVGIEICDAKDLINSKGNDELRELSERDMLAIDDLGKEPAEILDYGTVKSPVIDLLEKRYLKDRFTLITTNLAPNEIRVKYGVRIADRFREMFEVIPFEFKSYRQNTERRTVDNE